MVILGIWDGHDAGAACLVDGRVAAAVNEERLTRRKLEVGFPTQSVGACLAQARVAATDVQVVAASTSDPAKALERLMPWSRERYYRVRRRQVPPGTFAFATRWIKRRVTPWSPTALSRAVSRAVLGRHIASLGFRPGTLRLFDHHHCHAIAAAHASGFDRCGVVTIDGLGDGVSATVGRFEHGRIERLATSRAGDSLGVFFEHVTELLNMRELEDEGKVMALADYAAAIPDADNPLLSLFVVRDGCITTTQSTAQMSRTLRRVHWCAPNERFARLAQRTVEVVSMALVRDAVRITGCSRVALAGGVASNVKTNRSIRLLPEVEDVYVFPHMGDGGLAIGAAIAAYAECGTGPTVHVDPRAVSSGHAREEMWAALSRQSLSVCEPADLAAEVATRLAAGQIICWFQGGMEYGPRALGQRSIIARPDSPKVKDRLNLILKRRIWYQPFCPSLLSSEAPRLFDDWGPGPNSSRTMTMAYMTATEQRDALAGVINVDGSCRPQLVPDDEDSAWARLLLAMKARTGVGAVLNTSFNIHGEPLVNTPDQAVDVFLRGGADALVMGPFLVTPPLAATS
jgi:carbamoyltransferase